MVQITENASKQIVKMLDEAASLPAAGCGSGCKAGGCSGYDYVFDWEQEPRPDDSVFNGPGRRAHLHRPAQLPAARRHAVLDYDTNLVSKGFFFQNPNAKSTCGCGSFIV